jgi:anti-sigma factor (TIGR02949 family)
LLTCKDFLSWLNDYLDETADAETREQVKEHITNCPNCWVVYNTTKKTVEVYKGVEPQPVPEALREKLVALIQARCAKKTAGA